MAHDLRKWPATVYPDEAAQFQTKARARIDSALRDLGEQGPMPAGHNYKNLGARNDYLWQLNLKSDRLQIRILYSPYGASIVVFHIHKKGSPQEQQHGYAVAKRRKREAEALMNDSKGKKHAALPTIH